MNDGLAIAELRPMGGSWGGLLFDNPSIWRPPTFAWTFTFQYAAVSRSAGSTSPQLWIDWSPAATTSWQAMGGQTVSDAAHGPIESCVSFFEHHRYGTTTLHVDQQKTRSLHVVAELWGDLDALGIEALRASAWLLFDGITVNLSDPPTTADATRAMLEEHTDTTGLEGFARSTGFWFAPTDGGTARNA